MSEFDDVNEDTSNLENLQPIEKEDDKVLERGENDSDPGDPCNSYDWSVVFCFIFTVSIILWLLVYYKMFLSRGGSWNGLDRIFLLLGVSTLLQFGPMLSATIHVGHGVYSYTQTGCKLMFYTEYGTRHVISLLVLLSHLYGHVGLRHGFDSVDRKVRDGFGWFILFLVAYQGLFGIVPAMYVDVPLKEKDQTHCTWTQSMDLSIHEVVSMELILRPLTPYLIPLVGVVVVESFLFYRSASLIQLTRQVNEPSRVSRLQTILITVATYFALNSGYAIILLVEFGLVYNGSIFNRTALCNMKWFLFLVHQFWFLVAPVIYLIKELDGVTALSKVPLPAGIKDKLRTLAPTRAPTRQDGEQLTPNGKI